MHPARIAELLEPFLGPANDQGPFLACPEPSQGTNGLHHISTYIDILLRWNARINLTAIRNPEEIVTRHFGESLFAARHLFPKENGREEHDREGHDFSRAASVKKDIGAVANDQRPATNDRPAVANHQRPAANDRPTVADLGAGAGFPGLPIKLWAPHICLTLIESNHKKAAFLREVIRAITLTDVNVFHGRAEDLARPQPPSHPHGGHEYAGQQHGSPEDSRLANCLQFDLVTLRAVERFADVLPVAASLLAPAGRLALLIGSSQVPQARSTLPQLSWDNPVPVPLSKTRRLSVGRVPAEVAHAGDREPQT